MLSKKKENDFALLKIIYEDAKKYYPQWGDAIEKDYLKFRNILSTELRKNEFDSEYLYGRELVALSWHCQIFGNDSKIEDKILCKCCEIRMIISRFDWAGLWNKYTRVGVKYYDQLDLVPSTFHNLVIPETYGDGFSLHDLDELEVTILENLTNPLSIANLFKRMLKYVGEEIISDHLDEYKRLLFLMLKQLLLKKAIKPYNVKSLGN